MYILLPLLMLGCLGILFGIGLAFVSKRLAIKTDPRLEEIYGLLPGANCGACGGVGCFAFAESLLSGKTSIEACRVAEDKAKEQIAKLLGTKLEKEVKKTVVLHCYGGSKKVKDKFTYIGIRDCVTANLIMQGPKSCVYGCIGFGTCAAVCPFGAITMNEENLPIVDENKCKACNKCVEICPKRLFSLVSVTHNIYVACSSHDLGKDTTAVCPVGCIACGLCEKACSFDAIHVIDNLAVIDYNKCTSCGECVKVCPMKTIRIRP